MLHRRVVVLRRRALLELAQGDRHHLRAAGRTEAAPQQLLVRRIRARRDGAGQRHGKHVEQHCEAGDPGKCKPLSGHGAIRSVGRSGGGI